MLRVMGNSDKSHIPRVDEIIEKGNALVAKDLDEYCSQTSSALQALSNAAWSLLGKIRELDEGGYGLDIGHQGLNEFCFLAFEEATTAYRIKMMVLDGVNAPLQLETRKLIPFFFIDDEAGTDHGGTYDELYRSICSEFYDVLVTPVALANRVSISPKRNASILEKMIQRIFDESLSEALTLEDMLDYPVSVVARGLAVELNQILNAMRLHIQDSDFCARLAEEMSAFVSSDESEGGKLDLFRILMNRRGGWLIRAKLQQKMQGGEEIRPTFKYCIDPLIRDTPLPYIFQLFQADFGLRWGVVNSGVWFASAGRAVFFDLSLDGDVMSFLFSQKEIENMKTQRVESLTTSIQTKVNLPVSIKAFFAGRFHMYLELNGQNSLEELSKLLDFE